MSALVTTTGLVRPAAQSISADARLASPVSEFYGRVWLYMAMLYLTAHIVSPMLAEALR